MSIFGKIKDAIFGHKAHAQETPPPVPTSGGVATAPAPVAVDEMDVEAKLNEMGRDKNLNWRTSIVDLMKLIGVDSSLDNRKELARELGYSGDLDGSAEMNIWLHGATMRELAKNGGKVPAEFLD
ncbi:MAG TPA: DUF3597 domain-containing protein [Novosphingobium sp.]|nr:DUF3597 domain-containing protein [Novosphingobium sp.]